MTHAQHAQARPRAFPAWLLLALFVLVTGIVQLGIVWFFRIARIYWATDPHAKGPEPLVFLALLMPYALAFVRTERWTLSANDRRIAATAGVVAVILALLAAFLVQGQFPGSADEFSYLFEGRTFAAGRLWNPPPPGGQALSPLYVWVHGGKWVGQYTPGWPGAIALWQVLGLSPWLLGPTMLAVTLVVLYRLSRREAGSRAAALSVIIFGLLPFTSFNAGSLFSHMFSAALVVTALALVTARRDPRVFLPLAVGCAIGLLGITRLTTALVVIAAVGFDYLRRRDWRGLLLTGVGGAPFVAGLLWYQWQVTGHPFEPVYYIAGRTVDHLYFDPHSIAIGLLMTWKRFIDLGLWTSPGLVVLWFVSIWIKGKSRDLSASDLVFPLGVALLIFYPFPAGNKYGPRYYFDFFPMMIFTICTARFRPADRFRHTFDTSLLMALAAGLMTSAIAGVLFHRISSERQDLYDQVKTLGLAQSVVCVADGTGTLLPLAYHDLVRNDINATGAVLYANCVAISPARLAELFPRRDVWVYTRASSAPRGQLTRVR